MSWKWVIDARSDELKVDKRALAAALVVGVVLAVIAKAVLPQGWYYAVVAVLVVGGIAFDVWVRKRHLD